MYDRSLFIWHWGLSKEKENEMTNENKLKKKLRKKKNVTAKKEKTTENFSFSLKGINEVTKIVAKNSLMYRTLSLFLTK